MTPWRILETYFAYLAAASHAVDFGSRQPGPLIVRKVVQMATGFRYTIALPALDPVDTDVAERDLSITIAGTTTTVTGAHDATDLQFEAREGAHVVVTLTDVDASGNRSAASAPLEFDATDTVPPHQPGALAVESVEQVDLPDPTPPELGPTP